jgi:hypothetical protein
VSTPEEVIAQAQRYADMVANALPERLTDEDRRLMALSTFISWIQHWRLTNKENTNA